MLLILVIAVSIVSHANRREFDLVAFITDVLHGHLKWDICKLPVDSRYWGLQLDYYDGPIYSIGFVFFHIYLMYWPDEDWARRRSEWRAKITNWLTM